jgi:hypothetical protein
MRGSGPGSAEAPTDPEAQSGSHGVAIFAPDGSGQCGEYVPTSSQCNVDSASQIQRIDVARLIVVEKVLINYRGRVDQFRKVLGEIEPALGELRISQSPEDKVPAYEVSAFQTHVAAVWPDPI